MADPKKIAELFDVEINTINYHLKGIFKSAELSENSVIRKIRITADDGKKSVASHFLPATEFLSAPTKTNKTTNLNNRNEFLPEPVKSPGGLFWLILISI